MFSDKFMLVVAIIVCLSLGFGMGFLSKALADRVKIATLEKERDQALLAKATMKEQWEQAVNELNQTKVLLNDTLAALELLRQYQAIDNDTRDKIKDIEGTLDPSGDPTSETYDRFRKMIEDMNKKNEEYNTALAIATVTETEDGAVILDIRPFVELKNSAEDLFNEATDLLLKFKGK